MGGGWFGVWWIGIFTCDGRRYSTRSYLRTAPRVRGTLALEDLKEADLVVEAVFEDMALKKGAGVLFCVRNFRVFSFALHKNRNLHKRQQHTNIDVFGRLDKVCKPEAILASNTSTLSVDEIAAATSRPTRVLGMHFFSPAHIMKLVELVKGKETAPQVVAAVAKVTKPMHKVCVVVGNCFGFVGNRMLFPYKYELEFLVEEGACPYRIDKLLYVRKNTYMWITILLLHAL